MVLYIKVSSGGMAGILKVLLLISLHQLDKALWTGNWQLVGLATTWRLATGRGCIVNIRAEITWEEFFIVSMEHHN